MQAAIFRSLLTLTLISLSSISYGASVSVKWTGKVPTIDTPQNVTLNDNEKVT